MKTSCTKCGSEHSGPGIVRDTGRFSDFGDDYVCNGCRAEVLHAAINYRDVEVDTCENCEHGSAEDYYASYVDNCRLNSYNRTGAFIGNPFMICDRHKRKAYTR